MTVREARDTRVTALALEAGRGNPDALEEFIRATQADVWRLVRHLGGADVADDLAQETYARALVSLPGFVGRSSARAWLLAIARRAVVDHFRSLACRPRTSAGTDVAVAADRQRLRAGLSPGPEDVVGLHLLLEGLDPARREVLVLTQVLGLSYAEVAQICGCPVGTVRSRVARAREDMIRAMAHGDRDVDAG
ncbi:MAG TPA: sigma-70 family RNA polymerase sigma factor [Kineosporiaceae bacterium]